MQNLNYLLELFERGNFKKKRIAAGEVVTFLDAPRRLNERQKAPILPTKVRRM
jgi:hypothetical protein